MFTEGGGGRPADTDVSTQIAGLNITSFSNWAALTGDSLKIALNNGYCFAGNAALFGSADICIATKKSLIGMAGPAMIEGGGLGVFKPEDIGPAEMHYKNGHLDYLAEDEEEGTNFVKKLLSRCCKNNITQRTGNCILIFNRNKVIIQWIRLKCHANVFKTLTNPFYWHTNTAIIVYLLRIANECFK